MIKKFTGISVRAITAASGKKQYDVKSLCASFLDERHTARLIRTLGFEKVRAVPLDMTCADMCVQLVKNLLRDEKISPKAIGALVFVSQTNDTIAPASVFPMQKALGLSKDCYLNNLINGCAGSIHGIVEACALIAANMCDKALVCFGDTYCKAHTLKTSSQKANAALFGDGAGVVLLERDDNAPDLFFNLASHGELCDVIHDDKYSERLERLKMGVALGELPPESLNSHQEQGIMIDGTAIASFAIEEVIPDIKTLMQEAKLSDDELSLYLLHQANKTVLKALALNLGIATDKVPFVAKNTGNTSSASLALAMCESSEIRSKLQKGSVVLSAFGVGMHAVSMIARLQKTHIYDAVYF